MRFECIQISIVALNQTTTQVDDYEDNYNAIDGANEHKRRPWTYLVEKDASDHYEGRGAHRSEEKGDSRHCAADRALHISHKHNLN